MHFGYADNLPGAARASYRLHLNLRDLGVDSRMLVALKTTNDPTVIGPASRPERLATRFAATVERFAKMALSSPDDEVSLNLAGSGMARHVPTLQPDIVQLHWVGGGMISPAGFKAFQNLQCVWRLADAWACGGTYHYPPLGDTGVPGWLDRRLAQRKQRALRRIRELTAVSPSRWLAGQAATSDTLRERRVEVIHTGVDTQLFSPRDRAAARASLDIPADAPALLLGAANPVGNVRKGGAPLQLALQKLRHLMPDVHLLIFGGGERGSLKRLDLPVHDLGVIDDDERLATAYRAADAFAAPSLQENLANTVIESLASGTPVVAFRVGGMPEAIDHMRNGYLAEALSVDDLARGLTWALTTGRQDEVRQAARLAAVTRFDGPRQARRYLALYEELTAGSRTTKGTSR